VRRDRRGDPEHIELRFEAADADAEDDAAARQAIERAIALRHPSGWW
jgi:hypothetical protein